jgi:hypothetical protein
LENFYSHRCNCGFLKAIQPFPEMPDIQPAPLNLNKHIILEDYSA